MITQSEPCILIVEDEPEIASTIQTYLQKMNYAVVIASNIKSVEKIMDEKQIDIILLDLGLPDGDGIEFLKNINTTTFTGNTIIISSQSSEESVINGLNAGSDDYLIKPFNLPELVARIKNIRKLRSPANKVITINEIKINEAERLVTVNGNSLTLTKSEFDLLLFMVQNANMILSHSTIGRHLYKNISMEETTNEMVYNHIKNLKRKLMKFTDHCYIHSVYGLGYKFQDV
jgi:DNA-binding response OmpR family regulator